MKRFAWILCFAVTVAIALTPARAGFDGNVNFFLGQKSLDDHDWAPLDDQVEFGALLSFGEDEWPVRIAADVLTSIEEKDVRGPLGGNVTFTGSTFELDGGVRKIWKNKNVFPYLGAGVGVVAAWIEADNGVVATDAEDASLGFWASTGVFFRLGSNVNIGADVRYSTADVDLDFGGGNFLNGVNAGGLHYGMLIGFGW